MKIDSKIKRALRANRNRVQTNLVLGALTVAATIGLSGCPSTGAGLTIGPKSTGTAYVIQGPGTTTLASILAFNAGNTGSQTPFLTFTVPSGFSVQSVATDIAGSIYVGGFTSTQTEILVYGSGATGAATPNKIIYPTSTLLPTKRVDPVSMLVTLTGIYVVSPSTGIQIYSDGASGTSAPIREITSSALTGPVGVGTDSANNLYVSNQVTSGTSTSGQILEFSPTASGNVAPTNTINSSNTFYGISVDGAGDVTAAAAISSGSAAGTGEIVTYAAGATGTATPTATIAGSNTTLSYVEGLRIDQYGSIFVVNQTFAGNSYVNTLVSFAKGTTGNVAPAAVLLSSAWTNAGAELGLF